MNNINKNQIRFETPYVILRTDQGLTTAENTSINQNNVENSKENEKLLSIIFGYPYIENQA
jgi:hypothetical protein